jgi:hypothetical protein
MRAFSRVSFFSIGMNFSPQAFLLVAAQLYPERNRTNSAPLRPGVNRTTAPFSSSITQFLFQSGTIQEGISDRGLPNKKRGE